MIRTRKGIERTRKGSGRSGKGSGRSAVSQRKASGKAERTFMRWSAVESVQMIRAIMLEDSLCLPHGLWRSVQGAPS